MNSVIPKEYYILYVDILGYKSKIDSLRDDPVGQIGFLNDINNIVDDCYQKEKETWPIKVKVFSDNIIFAIDTSSDMHLERLCSIASRMQEMFLRRYGILFRGSITKGLLYIDEKFVFGQGLIDAYMLENNIATYPRIIIDKTIENEPYIVSSQHRIDKSLLYDDYKFINFLCYYMPSKGYESNRNIHNLESKIDEISKSTTDTRAIQKIKWVDQYVKIFIKKYEL